MCPAAHEELELARVVSLVWCVRIMATAKACVGAGYPPDYATMLRDLLAACKQSGGIGTRRVDASSSHSVYRRLDVTKSIFKGRVNVKVGGMDFVISDTGVVCESHSVGDIVVKGCSLGDGGVWLSVAAELVAFWLEIHVAMQVPRGVKE